MTMPIKKTISIASVYDQAKIEKNAIVRTRLLAIAAVLEGKKRSYAAQLAGVTINNMRIWIERFNEFGFEGLKNKKQPGKESKWSVEAEQYLKEKVINGASFEVDQRVTFRLVDLKDDLQKKFNTYYGISTIWYKLKDLKLSWLSVRPEHPKTSIEQQEEFKKKLQTH